MFDANGFTECCRGFGEHFDWCEVGEQQRVELRRLERNLRRDGKLAEPTLPTLDAWHAKVRAELPELEAREAS